jgi:bacterioferritin-associated ferredoxin
MVNRCICSNITFSEVKKIADKENFQTVDELRINEVCCRNCELCRPYVEEMLKTGETSFSPQDLSNREYVGRDKI